MDLRGVGLPSMEPRLRSRGSDWQMRYSVRRSTARRLQWSRGCEAAEAWNMCRSPTRSSVSSTTFNGAAAAKPRKRSTGVPRSLHGHSSFNGAAAAKPRKLSKGRLASVRFDELPSMEPPAKPAEAPLIPCSGIVGRAMAFNGAAAAKPRKHARRAGHRRQRRSAPSMEPRLRSRGSCLMPVWQEVTLRIPFNGAAAAKPRKLGRQSRRDVDGRDQPALQWSRGCEAAEARATAAGPGATIPIRAFNGAAAAKPRKHPDASAVIGVRTTSCPSMEPRLRSRGSRRACAGALWRVSLPSMEPRLRSRGSAAVRRAARHRPMAFNGAAAAKPRKRGQVVTLLFRALQREHLTFNGAAAAKPRKPDERGLHSRPTAVVRFQRRFEIPSMEPRLRSRGSNRA